MKWTSAYGVVGMDAFGQPGTMTDAMKERGTALHILNNFDIPLGFIRDNDDPANDDHTLWLSIANLAQLRYIVRTHGNPVPQLIEVGHVDFSAPGPRETALPHNAFTPLAV